MASDSLRLRPATPADAPLLRRWDQEPHVLASDPDDDWEWETELGRQPAWREQLIAELDGTPIGFVQIIDPAEEDSHYWGEVEADLRAIDLWIGPAERLGQGHGTRMMLAALARCFAAPRVSAVIIDPLATNERAHRFYQRLGFVALGLRRFGNHDCLVHRLERAAWQPPRADEAVLSFWFGAVPGERRSEWFRKDPAFDAEIAARFGPLAARAVNGEIDDWAAQPRSALARLIVLDQFGRNIHRGSARLAGDAQALAAAKDIVARGWDRGYLGVERWFAYLPFEHAEDLAMQQQALRLFAALERDEPSMRDQLEWAQKHHDIVARFGRFPHRNAALGRPSSAEELAFLAQPGSSF